MKKQRRQKSCVLDLIINGDDDKEMIGCCILYWMLITFEKSNSTLDTKLISASARWEFVKFMYIVNAEMLDGHELR